jgi:hypothetical protein
MKRVLLLVCLVTAMAGFPATARAAADDGWWGWIERLSGPGKFYGGAWEFSIVCVPQGKPKTDPDTKKPIIDPVTNEVVRETAEPQLCIVHAPPFESGIDQTKHVVALKLGHYQTGEQERFEDVRGDTGNVNMWEVGVTYKYRFHRSLKAGFGVSYLLFTGDNSDIEFKAFSRLALTPLSVSFAPLATVTAREWGKVVSLNFQEVYITKGFTGRDFGNTRTGFRADAELNSRFGIVVDALAVANAISHR